jgi:hypothetical protein
MVLTKLAGAGLGEGQGHRDGTIEVDMAVGVAEEELRTLNPAGHSTRELRTEIRCHISMRSMVGRPFIEGVGINLIGERAGLVIKGSGKTRHSTGVEAHL